VTASFIYDSEGSDEQPASPTIKTGIKAKDTERKRMLNLQKFRSNSANPEKIYLTAFYVQGSQLSAS
jgi:hypothetical protein